MLRGVLEELTLKGEDRHEIAAYRWRPEGKARGIVQISHGMAEHGARYERLAGALSAAGWAVYAHDHRGHGKSARSDDDVGHFADRDGWRLVLSDLRAVRAYAREQEKPHLPLVLLGHSMGSFIATSDTIDVPGAIDALVLSGGTAGGGALVRLGTVAARAERLRQGRRGKSPLLFALSFGSFNKPFEPARTEFDWLSRDPVEVDLYVKDPRCGFRCTNQLWIDLADTLIELGKRERLARIPKDLPIRLIAGARDPVCDMGKGVEAQHAQLESAGLTRVTKKLYADARHELFHEVNRDEVTEDLVAWLDALSK
jgi:alpha-beta hydrolase superfamily lysophospholipase